jgi:hypothetical protein
MVRVGISCGAIAQGSLCIIQVEAVNQWAEKRTLQILTDDPAYDQGYQAIKVSSDKGCSTKDI